MGTTYNLELDTFEFETDVELGTLQIEQVENSNKIMVELFPNNQTKESFENAEFSAVFDILELAPNMDNFIRFPVPETATDEQKWEISHAIHDGIYDMLETIRNIKDFEDVEVNAYGLNDKTPIYSTLEVIRANYLMNELDSFFKYRTLTGIYTKRIRAGLYEVTHKSSINGRRYDKIGKIQMLEDMFKIIDTINEDDNKRTNNLLTYLHN